MIASAYTDKVLIFGLLTGGLALYFAVRLFALRSGDHIWDFLIPGSDREEAFIRANETENIPLIQGISWANLANRVTTYSSIALGIILVAAIFLLAADPDDLSRTERSLFKIVLVLASCSVLVYLTSSQLWHEILGRGWEVRDMLRIRNWASFTRTIGQFTLVAALVLSMITVDTALGGVVATVAFVGVIGFFELRYRIYKQPAEPATEAVIESRIADHEPATQA